MDNKRYWIGGAIVAALLAMGAYHAKAADLGGNCCADLEERVAELEAVAVKKGNRKVSLTVSGYVSHSVMAWDDGTVKDVYIGDGGANSSRFRFLGSAKINADLTAGFTYEFGIHDNHLGSMHQLAGGDDAGNSVALRDSTVWMRHKNLGMVKLGQGSTATDNLILVDVSGVGVVATPDVGVFNNAFFLRLDKVTVNGTSLPNVSGTMVGLSWSALLNGGVTFDTARRNHVLYETPSLYGFSASAAIGEDNFWDAALRYAGEFSGVRVAGGVGYSVDTELPSSPLINTSSPSVKEWKGSVSAMHIASGIFANVAGGLRETDVGIDNRAVLGGTMTISAKDAHFWHATAGWAKNVTGLGNTILYGEYFQAKDMLAPVFTFDPTAPGANTTVSLSSDATMWGIGAIQVIDSAAMEVFLAYKNFSGEVSGSLVSPGPNGKAKVEMQDFQAVIGGVRISF